MRTKRGQEGREWESRAVWSEWRKREASRGRGKGGRWAVRESAGGEGRDGGRSVKSRRWEREEAELEGWLGWGLGPGSSVETWDSWVAASSLESRRKVVWYVCAARGEEKSRIQ